MIKRHQILIGAIFLLGLVLLLGVYIFNRNSAYEEVTQYSDTEFLYSCSKPIKVRSEKVAQTEGGSVKQIPVNMDEAGKYCKEVGIF